MIPTFLLILLIFIHRNGYDGSDDKDYSKQWSFSGAFLYSLTVITTIGEFLIQYSIL